MTGPGGATTDGRRIVIVGAGAIGSSLALAMAPRLRAVIADPDPAVRDTWSRRGHDTLDPRTDWPAFAPRPGDAAIIATRATLAERVIAALPPALPALCVCNGQNERLATVRATPTLLGVVDFAATCDRPGEPRATQPGALTMPMDSPEGFTRAIADAIPAGAIRAKLVSDVTPHAWSKLLMNASLDPVAALLDTTLGGVFADRAGFLVVRRLLREGHAVARALGVRPVPVRGTPIGLMVRVFHTPGLNRLAARGGANQARHVDSTMTADLRRGTPTEIDYLCGHIARAGERAGVPTPTHRAVQAAIEAAPRGPRANLADLLRA